MSLIDLLIIPLTMISYFQALKVTAMLNLGVGYFFLILFVMLHFFSSLMIIISNYSIYRQWKLSTWVIGMGPTVGAFLALFLITILPFLKWPFYIFKGIPNFELWINPLIMGVSAFITQIIMRKALLDPIFNININAQSLSDLVTL